MPLHSGGDVDSRRCCRSSSTSPRTACRPSRRSSPWRVATRGSRIRSGRTRIFPAGSIASAVFPPRTRRSATSSRSSPTETGNRGRCAQSWSAPMTCPRQPPTRRGARHRLVAERGAARRCPGSRVCWSSLPSPPCCRRASTRRRRRCRCRRPLRLGPLRPARDPRAGRVRLHAGQGPRPRCVGRVRVPPGSSGFRESRDAGARPGALPDPRASDGLWLDDGWGTRGTFTLIYAARGSHWTRAAPMTSDSFPRCGEAVAVFEYDFTSDGAGCSTRPLLQVDNKFLRTLVRPGQGRQGGRPASPRLFARASRAIEENPSEVYQKVSEAPTSRAMSSSGFASSCACLEAGQRS